MRKIGAVIAIAVALSATVANAEDSFTIEGDGLELVRKYAIDGESFDLKYEANGVDIVLSEDEALIPFVIDEAMHISSDEYGSDKIIYLNRRGEIDSVVFGEDSSLIPIGTNGKYIKQYNVGSAGEAGACYLNFDIYDKDDGYKFPITNVRNSKADFVKPFKFTDKFTISKPPVWEGNCKSVKIFGIDGLVISEINGVEYNLLNVCSPYDKDRDWIIAADNYSSNTKENPTLLRGTKIFDSNGTLMFTLNPTIYCDSSGSNKRDNLFYGSASYICQVGYDAKLYNYNEYEDVEFYGYSRNNAKLEVYTGEGIFLWDYIVPDKSQDISVFVSDNEKYLCFVHGNEASVFDIETSILKYTIPKIGFIRDGYVSNDGFVVSFASDTYRNKVCHNTISIFAENGINSTTIESVASGAQSNILIDPEGTTFVNNIETSVYIYTIK